MGAYNTVRGFAVCPRCATSAPVVVQFRYGDTWQHEYQIGDTLEWSGNNVGQKGKRLVEVSGIAENHCPHCGYDDEWNLIVTISNDRLEGIRTATASDIDLVTGGTHKVLRD